VIVVWINTSNPEDEVIARHFNFNTGLWGNEVIIGGGANSTGSHPEIVIDNQGNAIVLWESWINNDYSILSSRYNAASDAWSQEEEIETGLGGASNPKIVIDGNGNAIAVWEQFDGTSKSIFVNRFNNSTGQWENEQLIENGSGLAMRPQVAMNSSGNAVAIWEQQDGVTYSIYTSNYDSNSGQWSTSVKIGSGDASSADVIVYPNGDAIGVWDQGGSIYESRYFSSSGLWNPEEIISISGFAEYPQIDIDPFGNVFVVWRQLNSAFNHWASQLKVGSLTWSTPVEIETIDGSISNYVKIGIDPNGNVMAVWEEGDDIYATYYDKGSTQWGAVELIDNLNGSARNPNVAFGPTGTAIAVWSQEDGGSIESIFFNTYQ